MPALPVVPNVARVDVGYTVGADVSALNRFFVSWTGTPPSSATCLTLATDLYNIWAAEFHVYMHDLNSLTSLKFTDLTTVSSGQAEYIHTTAGSLTGDPMPAGTAFLGSMAIARRYRGGKPRMYLPLGDGNQILSAQKWTTAFQANVQASMNAVITDIAATASGGCALGTLVNVSYYHGFTVVTNPVTGRARNVPTLRATPLVDTVTAWSAEQTMASQRRRYLRQP